MDTKIVKRWDIFEITVAGPSDGNPFTEQWIRGTFTGVNETKTCEGFYDGDGSYKVRFMPSFEGDYSYSIETSFGACENGCFTVTAPAEGNHGPVRVAYRVHLGYEDGTPHYSFGTTCYVWELQSDELQEETYKSLAASPFNKIRFCLFPKHYDYNFNEPWAYPFEGTPVDSAPINHDNFNDYTGKTEGNNWDFTRFNIRFFRHIDETIKRLGDLGIEADIILFHPYDRWGFRSMTMEQNLFYLRYCLARFSAYHNVWWSLANEYDFVPEKSIADWEAIADTIVRNDPYQHLRSIHNGFKIYDHTRPWVTHCSMQKTDPFKTTEFADEFLTRYKKPVIFDEICYEGNIYQPWGNVSGKELVRRFWEAIIRGGYPGHGETILTGKDETLWWSHGGSLHGESPARIAFLRKIVEETPGCGYLRMTALDNRYKSARLDMREDDKSYYLVYYGFSCLSFADFYIDDETQFQVEVIDTWEMTIENAGIHKGKFRIPLPGKEYMAIRLRKV